MSIPEDVVVAADAEAARRGLSRSAFEEQRAAAARREQLLRLGAAAFIWNKIHE